MRPISATPGSQVFLRRMRFQYLVNLGPPFAPRVQTVLVNHAQTREHTKEMACSVTSVVNVNCSTRDVESCDVHVLDIDRRFVKLQVELACRIYQQCYVPQRCAVAEK